MTHRYLFAMLLLLPLFAGADTIVRDDGSTIRGEIKSENGGLVVIDTSFGEVTVPRSRILAISHSRPDEKKTVKPDEKKIAACTDQSPETKYQQGTTGEESWYVNVGLGGAVPQYSSDAQATVALLVNANSTSAVDLGIYWPIDKTELLGIATEGGFDRFSKSGGELVIIQSGLFLSGMHFFGAAQGSGFYMRGDIGLATSAFSVVSGNVTMALPGNKYGVGVGGALGYGIPFESVHLLVQVGHMNRDFDTYSVGWTALTVSGLF